MTTHTLRVGSEVYVLAMRPIPLFHLIGCGGPVPFKVCKAEVKAIAAGGSYVTVDDVQLAPLLGGTPSGGFTAPITGIMLERSRAVHLGCDELVTLAAGPLGRVVADYPDLGRAIRGRWAAFIDGELLDEPDLVRAREVRLC